MQFFDSADLTLVILGLGALGLATLLHRFDNRPFSFPILALALGYAAIALPLGLTAPNPLAANSIILHLTELGVIVSLMGVGLKIDRPLGFMNWITTWRLLAITMPLTIIAIAALGWWWLALPLPAAVLLGAVLAPTDPVLASDVQMAEPGDEEQAAHEAEAERSSTPPLEDEAQQHTQEVRFALTTEAGLNDSLAFPFTWLAIILATTTDSPDPTTSWLTHWLLIDVGYRLTIGLVIGIITGWILARLLLSTADELERGSMRIGIGALAATLLSYSLTECINGYGFLAVFITALTMRTYERNHHAHRTFHNFAEQTEQLLMLIILIGLGAAIAGGLLSALTLPAAMLGLALLFIIRPAAGLIGLIGCARITLRDRFIISFFGIRGIGSIFYLSFALHETDFARPDLLWATTAFIITGSIIIHGVTAAPAIAPPAKRDR